MGSSRATAGIVACALAGLALAGSVIRERRVEPPRPAADAPLDLPVKLYGCSAVLRGPICETDPSDELHIWLPGVTDDSVHVTADDHDLPVTLTAWPDGRTVRTTVPGGASRLDVRASLGGHPARWSAQLTPAHAIHPGLARARELRSAGRLDEAQAALDAVPEADGGRAAVMSLRARLDFQRGRIEEAVRAFRASIALHETDGRLSEAADDATALTYILLDRGRIGEARAVLSLQARLSTDYADGQGDVLHNEGLLASRAGDRRTALRRAREAEAYFARIGNEPSRRVAAAKVSSQLQALGRYGESTAALQALLDAPDVGDCDRADELTDLGWGALLAVEANVDAPLDARAPLTRALELLRSTCPAPNRAAGVLENLALAELQHGQPAQARAALDDARKAQHDPPVPDVLFWHHLAGRIALAQGAPAAALASFAREDAIAAALGTGDDRRSAAEGKAAALAALGRKPEALAALDAADAFVDAESESIPLGEGRDTFFGTRDRAAARRVALLVDLGRTQDAMTAARHWRARLIRGVRVTTAIERLDPATRERWDEAIGRYRQLRSATEEDGAHDWELSADRLAAARARHDASETQSRAALDDALRLLPARRPEIAPAAPPAPGELELLFVPSTSGWLGFARTAGEVSVAPIERIDPRAPPGELSRVMLRPFDAEIASATTIRFMPYGVARAIDLHTLPWQGRPLIDHAGVAYSLGLGEPAAPVAGSGEALVVADPAGDLPSARAEADAVIAALQRSPDWTAESLRGASAQGQAVRAALPGVGLFHYAGHATFGGVDGLESALSLAGGSRLTPSDILALPRVPPIVALFGCDTARESAVGTLDALGLTGAFLVAGTGMVIATSRGVDDALSRDVATEFYARWLGTPRGGPAEALRSAVLAVRERSPGSDWGAFRLLMP
jgi:tetratricopeptide (TPR) repeat protein